MSGALRHSPAKIVQQLLIDLGLAVTAASATTTNWPCFTRREPDSPDNCITTYNTEGRLEGRVIGGETLEVHGIQIRVRCTDPDVGQIKVNDIVVFLDEEVLNDTVVIGDYRYKVHAMSRSGSVSQFGMETPTSLRDIWTINYIVTVTSIN